LGALAAAAAAGMLLSTPAVSQAGFPRTVIAEEFGATW